MTQMGTDGKGKDRAAYAACLVATMGVILGMLGWRGFGAPEADSGYFFGEVYRDGCQGRDVIRWTNCPAAVVVQTTTNLNVPDGGWRDRMVVGFVGPSDALYCFEWPETNVTHGAQFTRLKRVNGVTY